MAAKPKLLVTCRPTDRVVAEIEQNYDAAFRIDGIAGDGTRLARASAGMDGIFSRFTDPLNAATINALGDSVGIIAAYAVGYENIDVAAATARGIAVTNTPGVLTDATAEMAMLLMLGAARCQHEGTTLLRNGQWDGPTTILGTLVSGKRLGIVGLGRIGKAVARRARGFDMEIHYHDIERLAPAEEQGAIFHADVNDMLPLCDVLSLHCVYSPATRQFLNAGRLARLPDGAVVVNTARGGLIDDSALIGALQSGKVAAAGLDVFEGEPNLDPRYLTLSNTFLMPHLGTATQETRDAMGFKALSNLDAFFAGKVPPDRVN
jgi:lactate dehydrogenase-like 2-hydroxyacid dehydrogenase